MSNNTKPERKIKALFLNDIKERQKMVGAFLNSNIIGWNWYVFQKFYSTEIEKWINIDGVFLWRAFVMKKYRKKGIGMQLLEHTLKITKKSYEGKAIFTFTGTHNTISQRMLEFMGFKKQAIISYYRFGNLKKWSVKLVEKSDNSRKLIKQILQKNKMDII